MNILMVLTSNDTLGNSEEKTGFYIEEFAAPYYVFKDAGATITIASPKGAQPPVDPKSETAETQTADTERFYKDNEAIDLVAHTVVLSTINPDDFDAVFYPGGYGPLWDLENDLESINIISELYKNDKPIAFVSHSVAAILNVKDEDGEYLVKDKEVTSFSNSEEEGEKERNDLPYSVEDELVKKGANYSKGKDGESYVKKDDLLITGQNSASSKDTAETLLKTMEAKTKEKAAKKSE